MLGDDVRPGSGWGLPPIVPLWTWRGFCWLPRPASLMRGSVIGAACRGKASSQAIQIKNKNKKNEKRRQLGGGLFP